MTRQNKLDQTVIENAQGLDFIVLDELHTYRGRQGADVAMLVRRLRDRLCRRSPAPLHRHIGDDVEPGERHRACRRRRERGVAALRNRTFPPDAVIDETLERATDAKLKPQSLGAALAKAVDADLPAALTDEALRSHPLAVWIELEIGLARRSSSFGAAADNPRRSREAAGGPDRARRRSVAGRSSRRC